jgi:hypothetical protein
MNLKLSTDMRQTVKPIITEVGKIWGRDAIFLDQFTMLSETKFQLKGAFNTSLCSNFETHGYLEYTIVFSEVVFLSMIEHELDDSKYESAFDLVENSKKINNLSKMDEINNELKHFIFRTYDTVFEIIAMGYKLELGALRLKSTEKA